MYDRSDSRTWINSRYLLFLDEMAFVIGLVSLVQFLKSSKRGVVIQNDNNGLISLEFLSKWLYCLCQMKLKSSNHPLHPTFLDISILEKPKTPTDACLRVMVKVILRAALRNESVTLYAMNSFSPSSTSTDECGAIHPSGEDSFQDLLTKCAVVHLTRFYQSLRTEFVHRKCTTAVSHYKALYWFKQGQYVLVQKLCKDILEEENHPKTESFISFWSKFSHLEYRIMPICEHPFLELFDSDVIALLGLARIVQFKCDMMKDIETNRNQIHLIRTLPLISPCFIARYLNVRCLLNCNRPRNEIVVALRLLLASGKMFIEQAMAMYLTTKIRNTHPRRIDQGRSHCRAIS